MENTSNNWEKKPREMFYFRQRYKNRVFNRLAEFFAGEAKDRGLTKKIISERLGKDPAQITRWLSNPGNLTFDTLSDLLFAMEAEPEPPVIIRLEEKAKPNYVCFMISEVLESKSDVKLEPIEIVISGTSTDFLELPLEPKAEEHLQ